MAAKKSVSAKSGKTPRRRIPRKKKTEARSLSRGKRPPSVRRKTPERRPRVAAESQAEQSIRQSHEALQAICEGITDGLLIAERQSRQFRHANSAICRMLGYSEGELLKMSVADIHPPEALPDVFERFDELAEGRRHLAEGIPFRRKDGSLFYADIAASPVSIQCQGRPCSIAFIRDVTERRQVEEELKTKDRAIASSLNAIAISDIEGNLTYVNPAFLRMWGYRQDKEVLGRPATAFWQTKEHAAEALHTVQETGAWFGELVARRKDRTCFPVQVSANTIPDEAGRPKGIIGSFADMTDRRRAEDALRESEERFRALFEQAGDSIVLIDVPTGALVEFNDMAYQTLGYTRQEVEKLTIADFEVYESAQEIAEHLEKIVKQGSDAFDTKHRTKGGDVRDIQVKSRAISIRGKDFVQSIWRDITERKRAEEALRRARDELEIKVQERAAELIEANRRLREEIAQRKQADERLRQLESQLAHVARVSTMGEMASGLAHELNQPLAALCSYAEACLRLIDSGADVARLREPLEDIAAQAYRCGEMIHRLRSLVQRRPSRRSSTEVNRLVREVAQLMEHEAHEGGVSVQLDLAEPLPPVLVDSIQIQQVLVNLVRNAIQALAARGAGIRQIGIQTTATRDEVLLVAVHDSGPGLAPEIAGQVFDPFFSTKPEAMGMGLSISRSIVEAHGGRLWAAPRAEGGATFQFTLPVNAGKKPRNAQA